MTLFGCRVDKTQCAVCGESKLAKYFPSNSLIEGPCTTCLACIQRQKAKMTQSDDPIIREYLKELEAK